ncbi:AraC family transcriptional regulator [Desulfotomaculum arcticum]|uniref:AraC family transcriptional regulator n=1 Tax=Desulfotruncus arcticus DSM 17038 TaxID=1121424 RepID=A0A1I2W2C3_9FIRM|nr:helix-turn-helix domain-containing protein [Desulfotruncus arcticus]SFG93681.1 AraC family transcriptional regulator [Desulfotomaculum arcticum] [Desulfotruncus arcticus DSM 17038]
MNYIEIVNDAIQYIESNLHRRLSLEELASRYFISPMYFYRIFRAVTNQTVKSYVLARKLSAAALALKNTNLNVADIAFRYGFNSHEQFTRDFLKKFHVTPSHCRKENISVSLMAEMDIVERDFRNKNNEIVVDYSCREIEEIKLLGREVRFNPWNSCELEEILRKALGFIEEYIDRGTAGLLYSTVQLEPGDPPRIYCFYGITEEEYSGDRAGLVKRNIPRSRYAIFRYPGNMGLIFRTVEKDFYKWLNVTKFEINKMAGIDYFTEDCVQTEVFNIYIPVL